MITEALHGTSVTAVLIGEYTANRSWVQHEIVESWNCGNGLVGIRIHRIKDLGTGRASSPGPSPFEGVWVVDERGVEVELEAVVDTYAWVRDDGFSFFAVWIEEAALAAGR